MMNHKKIFSRYVKTLVDEWAVREADGYKLFFKALPEIEKSQLLHLYLETIDRNAGEIAESIYGNKKADADNDFICSLLTLFQSKNPETSDDLVNTMIRNIEDYFSNQIQHFIDRACVDRISDEKINGGCHV